MALAGASVLVLEAEARVKDRVRGECMMPWGVAEAMDLGIYDALAASCAHELPYWDSYQGPNRTGHRDLTRTTTPKLPAVSFYHPAMQETLLGAAQEAGAEVCRGARVTEVGTESGPAVVAEVNSGRTEIRARMVVGADGRNSVVRSRAGFPVQRDPDQNLVAGVLYEDMQASEDASHFWLNPGLGQTVLLFPQGQGRARAYVCYPSESGYRLSGDGGLPRFVEDSVKTGAPLEYYERGKAAGPLATFDGACIWVESPYKKGVALIGDAAGASDPTWGQGLSLTLRDVRVLRDQLLSQEDWDQAGLAYAREHDRYFGVTHTVETWMTRVLMDTGPEADARRERALLLWREDRTRQPDVFFSGPDQTVDETVRRRFFGEE